MAEVGRLALRVEGNFWNAYWAPRQDTMDDAILLGSIRMNTVENNDQRKQAFMRLMTGIVAEGINETFGVRPRWEMRPAPEGERGGNA